MTGEAIVLAVVGVMGVMVGVLVWLIKKQFNQNDRNTKDSNDTNRKLAESINRLSLASERQVQAIEASRDEQRKFEQLVTAKLDHIDDKADRNYDAIVNQTVKEQTVEHQTIKEATTKRR